MASTSLSTMTYEGHAVDSQLQTRGNQSPCQSQLVVCVDATAPLAANILNDDNRLQKNKIMASTKKNGSVAF
jgi:hypothetical protein